MITDKAIDYLKQKYQVSSINTYPVTGGYSLNRRAIVDTGKETLFVKEVDTEVLSGDGRTELDWLKKDHMVATTLGGMGVGIVPEWTELSDGGHMLMMPSYRKEDGWHWSLPADGEMQTNYIQAVVDAVNQIEAIDLADDQIEQLSLQPYFRDKLAYFDGINPLFSEPEIRQKLKDKYKIMEESDSHLATKASQMLETLYSDDDLRNIQLATLKLVDQPNNYFNHCDVRSDNLAYNQNTGKVKFVDWNWASFAPAKFGTTEFLIDMARRGVDISRWADELNTGLLAASIGFYLIRCLDNPPLEGSLLRVMQSETAASANFLYWQLAVKLR